MRRFEPFFDCLTFSLLLASLLVCVGTLVIVSNPDVPLNPLPPPTLPAIVGFPTETPTPTITTTPTITFTPSITPTFTPSATPTASFTPTPTATTAPPTITPTSVLANLPAAAPNLNTPLPIPTNTSLEDVGNPQAVFPFEGVVDGLRRNTSLQGCDWMSIAGRVTGLDGEAVPNIAVEVSGNNFQEVQFSGSAPAFGRGGFEINVGSRPRSRPFSIRLLDSRGEPISEYLLVETGDSCDTNIIVVGFNQTRAY